MPIWDDIVDVVVDNLMFDLHKTVGRMFQKVADRIGWGGRKPDERQSPKAFGAWAEDRAGEFLESQGMKILCRNYRTGWGELDLVAKDGEFIVFVEVKAGRGVDLEPELKVNRHKRRRMKIAARSFAARKNIQDAPMRFDIVTVEMDEGGNVKIEHEENAFTYEGR